MLLLPVACRAAAAGPAEAVLDQPLGILDHLVEDRGGEEGLLVDARQEGLQGVNARNKGIMPVRFAGFNGSVLPFCSQDAALLVAAPLPVPSSCPILLPCPALP